MNKLEITKKRWSDGSGYDVYIQDEFLSFRKNAWKKQVLSHFPPDKKLMVLDIGTGPGFFACILSEEGHQVVGIDSSEGMLSCAEKNAQMLGVRPTFILMDGQKPTFEDNTFDLVINRNVTWTLFEPENAYAQWKRVLKSGGRLLIYDANWHLQFYDAEIDRQVKKNEREYFEKYGKEFVVCSYDDGYKEYYDSLPLSNILRPQWDCKVLDELGFSTVNTLLDIGKRVYENWEKALYSASPLFEIEAIK